MSFRLSRIALLANRSALLKQHAVLRPTLKHVTINQVRKVTSTSVAREQYLHGYKDNERFHGKLR
jgi:hypothetical protein